MTVCILIRARHDQRWLWQINAPSNSPSSQVHAKGPLTAWEALNFIRISILPDHAISPSATRWSDDLRHKLAQYETYSPHSVGHS